MLSRGFIGLANVVLPGKGLKQGPFVTEEEIRTMADVAADERRSSREERKLIHSIFEFGDTVVREVMLPRPDMVAVEVRRRPSKRRSSARSTAASRAFPRTRTTPTTSSGLVYLKDLVAPRPRRRGRT